MRGDASSRLVASSSLSLVLFLCAKVCVISAVCRKANEANEEFWSVFRSFGMEKKQVLNSLSLSPLSETQRERERESTHRRLYTGDAHHGRERKARAAFLRFSERERERKKVN